MVNKFIKLLKEKEKLLMDVEKKLSDQLESLKKEEIYLLTILTQKGNEDEDGEEEERTIEVTGAEDMDNDAINRVPLTHLNAASESFYKMFAGNDSQKVEEEEVEDDEDEEEEEDSGQEVTEKTEEQNMAAFQGLMNSMVGEG